ncbi:cyclic AMP-responsive element-binding protein 3-like protein 4 isoform X2 [Pelmatolapia mariae]|uniref:cyclic AMP-responsive element-binding protein 3-like protein 4 isoform X2 n=1 Tax=Pelmatolapia mariae TaxID=158779 RepID=UPI002FE67A4A
MDAESGELFLGAMASGSWQLDGPFSSSELIPAGSEKPLQDWAVDPECILNDSDSEDVLHAVDPNEVFPSGPPADPSSESDSGISEDPAVESPITTVTAAATQLAPTTVYQLVYDISGLGGAKTGAGQENIISIELDQWSSQLLLSDSCVVSELPVVSAQRPAIPPPGLDDDLLCLDLQLTEEEQKLLTQEGVSLPSNLPLTKAEERILKKVRRKIRNKQSAQDSRRRRKEYIDGLESRSLLAQLQQLQSLIKQTVSKGAQTSTCLLIILVSLGLIILPSFSPFSRHRADDDYRPTGVISRNILTDPSSSQSTSDDAYGATSLQSEPPAQSQSKPPEGMSNLPEPTENHEHTAADGTEGSRSGNGSAVAAEQTEPGALGQKSTVRGGRRDQAKPGHADEM